jgi:hypothetical protein
MKASVNTTQLPAVPVTPTVPGGDAVVASNNLNESTPAEQRVAAPVVQLDAGPTIDPSTKAYAPAVYALRSGVIRQDR